MGGSGWLATCLDCSCPARTPWSVAATHRLDKIRRRAAQPYTIVSLSIQYFRNASHLDCRQLEKEKLSSLANIHACIHSHNTNNIIFTCTTRTLHPAPAVKCSLLWNICTLTDRRIFFAQLRRNKASAVTIGAGSCQMHIAGSWRTLAQKLRRRL